MGCLTDGITEMRTEREEHITGLPESQTVMFIRCDDEESGERMVITPREVIWNGDGSKVREVMEKECVCPTS